MGGCKNTSLMLFAVPWVYIFLVALCLLILLLKPWPKAPSYLRDMLDEDGGEGVMQA